MASHSSGTSQAFVRRSVFAVLLLSTLVSGVFAASGNVSGTSPGELVSLVQAASNEAGDQLQTCTKVMDLLLLVDDSASIGSRNFEQVRKFVLDFIDLVPISSEEVHLSVVTFADSPQDVFTFKQPQATNKQLAKEAFKYLRYRRGGSTATDKGLIRARRYLTRPVYGTRANVPKVLVLMTDGESDRHYDTIQAADQARAEGISVFVVGVGMANPVECRGVCGCGRYGPCPQFIMSNWNELVQTVDSIMGEVCKKLPKDAECSEWSEWSGCTASCGAGTRTKTRKQLSPPLAGDPPCDNCEPMMGKTCEDLGGLVRVEDCNQGECPQDAGCGTWGEWTSWSATCGHASRSRKREGYNTPPPRGAGLLCEQKRPPVPREQSEETDFAPCPRNQVPGEWTDWSVCSATCGGGTRHRSRSGSPQVGELYGGQTLQEQGIEVRQEEACSQNPCPVDAVCGEFGEWSECSRSCGGGVSVRKRDPWNNDQQHGGKSCKQQFPEGREETKECNPEPCPVDEVPGDWIEWGPCSVTCGTGVMTRQRGPSRVEARFGGKTIAEQNARLSSPILMQEEKECSPFPCGPCTYEFGPWGTCRGTCNDGFKIRHAAVRFDYTDAPCNLPTMEVDTCVPEGCSDAGTTVPGTGGEPGGTGGESPNESTNNTGNSSGSTSGGAAEETTTTDEDKDEQGGIPTAAIAGGVVGGVLLLGAAAGGGYYMMGSAGASAAGEAASADFLGDQQTAEVEAEDKEEMFGVDEDSEMWSA
ncbi:hypothetical protein NCLIV_033690 [Neospora caninum Liverpool]|uniref:VWFA domain-containing protein n=2 Tax=Neospora caninum TaxID=29176 RepID=F0VIM1_NEOCL|nr:hypothetical protein NCLIV_033690 [Neospora caninum Liverpool]ADM25314.1 MIC2-like protein 1 [Neospora caninum]CBZ53582.1 hypothetical protein NCLIV_033690 [Neospora caninum Liverpool]CEL67570.1 TPA: hypothetical protein BN1204_033690 [Neospora caninum Liverpool]|eukprot:XP_003883614.1 hypothetical protein NCLIV_033690 [Neospora caninum Liverpool]